MRKSLTMLAVGDRIFGGPQPDLTFALAIPVFTMADVFISQREAPFTSRSVEKCLEIRTWTKSVEQQASTSATSGKKTK